MLDTIVNYNLLFSIPDTIAEREDSEEGHGHPHRQSSTFK